MFRQVTNPMTICCKLEEAVHRLTQVPPPALHSRTACLCISAATFVPKASA